MSDLKRRTRFIEEPTSMEVGREIVEPAVQSPQSQPREKSPTNAEEKPTQSFAQRFPLKPTVEKRKLLSTTIESREGKLTPVFTGSPWNHYKVRFRIKLGYSFGVVTARTSGQVRMIRTITGPNVDEKVQRFRQLRHSNIVNTVEIYDCQDDNFLVSEFMMTSLWHICRSPIYPTEQQLSSILHQVLSGGEFLLENNLTHEQLSPANILVNREGEVKISDIESCRQNGDVRKLVESFSRLMMKLMDKEKSDSAAIGLSRPDRWSNQAIDMFTTAVSKLGMKRLLNHEFLQERRQIELVWLVHLVLISASHDRG